MAEPWPLTPQSNDVVSAYYEWAAKNYSLFSNDPMLCNWFPLSVLIEFAAVQQLPVTLDFWSGQASTSGKRFWDTSKTHLLKSHGGKFASKGEFLRRARNTVTARMIANMNTVAVETSAARPGDMLCYYVNANYWHVQLITSTIGGRIDVQAGNVPAEPPAGHANRNVSTGRAFGGSPRRWEFEEIFAAQG